MRNKRSVRVIAWILSVMLLVTSLGLDSLTVSAAQTGATGEEQSVVSETVQDEGTTDGPVAEPDASVSATGDGFTYTADFTTGYNTASMVFTLEKIGESAPTGSNNIDVYIRATGVDEEFRQIGWYEGLVDNQITFSKIQYQWQALTPGVSYDLKIALRHDGNIVGEAVTSFTTKAVTVTGFSQNQTFGYTAEDSGAVLMKMDNGATAYVDSNFNIPDNAAKCRIEFYGTKGSILSEGTISQVETGEIVLTTSDDTAGYNAKQNREDGDGSVVVEVETGNMYEKEISSFANAIINDTEPAITACDAINVQTIVEKAYEASAEGVYKNI